MWQRLRQKKVIAAIVGVLVALEILTEAQGNGLGDLFAALFGG